MAHDRGGLVAHGVGLLGVRVVAALPLLGARRGLLRAERVVCLVHLGLLGLLSVLVRGRVGANRLGILLASLPSHSGVVDRLLGSLVRVGHLLILHS